MNTASHRPKAGTRIVCAAIAASAATSITSAQTAERKEIAVQGKFADSTTLANYYLPAGFTNDVIIVPGWAVYASGGTTIAQFSDSGNDYLIDYYLDQWITDTDNNIDPDTTAVVIIDIETPVKLYEYSTLSMSDYSDCLSGLITRIDKVRAAFPNATLGLYGTVNPTGTANYFINRGPSYEMLAEDGAFDDLDIWVPVLYIGVSYNQLSWSSVLSRIGTISEQGLDEALALNDLEDAMSNPIFATPKPIYPLLAFENYGGTHDEKQMHPMELAHQINVVRDWFDTNSLTNQWAIWIGNTDDGTSGIGTPIADSTSPFDLPSCVSTTIGYRDLDDMLEEIVCRADMDGDGDLDSDDTSIFTALYMANDPRADFTGEGTFNNSDINAFTSAYAGADGYCQTYTCP